ncbi:ABC transporter substrate-binding protein [Microbacterium rhizophilus]|uniref:ABC transporter substrate-binding protein n=1 Tax=Microbacterium rhizophilus TaxID=3138934 RepID=UPI0031E7A861
MRIPQMRVLGIVGTAIAALALAACSSDAPAATPASSADGGAFDLAVLTDAAKAEGSLTLYGDASDANLSAWTKAFTDKYGIQVFVVRNTPGPLYQQFAQEQSAGQGQADIISIVDFTALDQAVDQGWLAEYTPQAADQYPAELGRAGYYYPVENGNAQSIAYNPDKLSDDEIALIQDKGMEALEDPRFADRIGVVNPQISSGVQAFWYTYTDGVGSDLGWDGLQKIADNTSRISDTLTLGQNLIQGEIDIAVPIVDSWASAQIVNNGAPLEFAYPKPTIGQNDGVAVVADSPHPNAARLFMEWASTAETNAMYSKLSQSAPTNTEAADSRELAGLPWYAPAGDDTWFDFAKDQDFLDAMTADGPYFPKWNETFGYAG